MLILRDGGTHALSFNFIDRDSMRPKWVSLSCRSYFLPVSIVRPDPVPAKLRIALEFQNDDDSDHSQSNCNDGNQDSHFVLLVGSV